VSGVENWPSIRSRRVRVVVSGHCPVCDGKRLMRLVLAGGLTVGAIPCWHCAVPSGAEVPLFPTPTRIDRSA
jgi:hypothetical protein